MAKVVLQSVGEDVVAFGDKAYWVAENVKRFLPNFAPGMEVDVTVKEINGQPLVTFLKKSGFAPGGAPQQPHQIPYQAPPQQYQASAQPYTPPMAPPRPPTPAKDFGELADAIFALVAVEIVKGGLDTALIESVAKTLAGKNPQ